MGNGNDQRNFLKGLMLGSFLGILAGIFFASKPGKELRSKIEERGTGALKDAKEIYEGARTLLDDVQRHAEELKEELFKVSQTAKEILGRSEKKET